LVVSARSRSPELLSRELPNDRLDIAAQHGLAAGQPQLFDAQRHEYLANVINLFVREHLLFGRDRRLAVRQAVETTEVTPIRQRNAQVANGTVVRISQHRSNHTRWLSELKARTDYTDWERFLNVEG
jgi:hypothetical protein